MCVFFFTWLWLKSLVWLLLTYLGGAQKPLVSQSENPWLYDQTEDRKQRPIELYSPFLIILDFRTESKTAVLFYLTIWPWIQVKLKIKIHYAIQMVLVLTTPSFEELMVVIQLCLSTFEMISKVGIIVIR